MLGDKFSRELNIKKAVLDRGNNGNSVPFYDISFRERKRVLEKFGNPNQYFICNKGSDVYRQGNKVLRKYNLGVRRISDA